MKKLIILSLLSFLTGGFAKETGKETGKAAVKEIKISEINKIKIMGLLGKPIHTIQAVECQVVSMSFTRRKADRGRKALLVLSVAGKKLAKKEYLDLPAGITQKNAVLNKVYKVWAYETLVVQGYPGEAFNKLGIRAFASQGLHFRSQLIFLKEIK